MPKKHPHTAASQLAGNLFGKILNRDADREGYAYVLDSLETGRSSVRQHVVEMLSSDEFIDKFLKGAPTSAVRTLNKVLLGVQPDAPRLEREARKFIRMGLRSYADELLNSAAYRNTVGEDSVPPFGH